MAFGRDAGPRHKAPAPGSSLPASLGHLRGRPRTFAGGVVAVADGLALQAAGSGRVRRGAAPSLVSSPSPAECTRPERPVRTSVSSSCCGSLDPA